ncbi:hypothetical protein [Variovorax sp. HJSM1_2]|uniref:hypothetical protein n=1 Tax=Variovorax sp. HJSM1_2 TaxID=3366263 RepID=UPI003BBA1445
MQITVVNAYLPRLDQAGISRFIERDIDDWRRSVPELQAKGFFRDLTSEDVDLRCEEMREDLDADLQQAALFELQITGNRGTLEPSDIGNPVTGLQGWEPAFLSADGAEVVHEGYQVPPTLGDFRLVFWIHDWADSAFLFSPWGNLILPTFQPVPERLWRLAPYSPLD